MRPLRIIMNGLTKWLTHKPAEQPEMLCDFERIRHEVKPCDVLLVEGRSRVSQVIKQMTQSPWSHAMLYLGRVHNIEDETIRSMVLQAYPGALDEQLVIESELGLGTVVRPLTHYQGEHLRICRPKGINYQDSQKVLHFAINRLGTGYDVRQILDLARFFFPYGILPRRLGSSLFQYEPGAETKTVCSTMIAEAFSSIHFPILPLVKQSGISQNGDNGVQLFQRNPKLCTPRDFDYSPYFQIIKYPFVNYSYHADYRLLPWHGRGVLEGQEAEMYMSAQQLQALKDQHQNTMADSLDQVIDEKAQEDDTTQASK